MNSQQTLSESEQETLDKVNRTVYMDAVKLACPLPVLKAKKYVQEELKPGERLVVKTSDKSFEIDFRVLCDRENCILENVEYVDDGKMIVYTIFRTSTSSDI